jgi:single-stranded DNA-binding protein
MYKEHDDSTKICKVALFGKSATFVDNNFKKGDSVAVEGSVTLNNYTTKDGEPKSGLSVNAFSVKAPPKKDDSSKT